MSKTLWKNIDLSRDRTNSTAVWTILKKYSDLHTRRVSTFFFNDDISTLLRQRCLNLQSLWLWYDKSTLRSVLLPDALEELRVEPCSRGPSAYIRSIEMKDPRIFQNLKRVWLKRVYITLDFVHCLLSQKLESAYFEECVFMFNFESISEHVAGRLNSLCLMFCKSMRSERSLYYESCTLGSLQPLADLMKCPTEMYLRSTGFSQGTRTLRTLSNISNVKYLCLRNFDLERCRGSLCQMLMNTKSLVEIGFINCKLDKRIMTFLVAKFPDLGEIRLMYCFNMKESTLTPLTKLGKLTVIIHNPWSKSDVSGHILQKLQVKHLFVKEKIQEPMTWRRGVLGLT